MNRICSRVVAALFVAFAALVATAAGLGRLSSPAPARIDADPLAGSRIATNCGGGVSAINVRMPAGFDPLTATDAELARRRHVLLTGTA